MFYRLLYEISQHDKTDCTAGCQFGGQNYSEGERREDSCDIYVCQHGQWTLMVGKKVPSCKSGLRKKKIKKNESYKRSHIYHRMLARIFAHIRQRLSLHSPQAAHPGTSILRTGLRIPWIAKLRFAAAASGRTRGRWTRPVSMECISSWGCSHLRT